MRNLSFGIEDGECFALLGVNGAGKSTTFKVLMNQINPSNGLVTIESYNVATESTKTRRMIGYCPQTNPIFNSLTVVDHLNYYA